MLRLLTLVPLAGAPGWLIAFNDPKQILLGWVLSIALLVGVLWVMGRRPTAAPTIETATAGWVILEREVARARRYGQALTLIHIDEADPPVRLSDVAATSREIDIAWQDDGIWLLAVGADESGREPLLTRLRGQVAGLDGERMRALTFPGDAMTVRALVAGLTTDHERPIRLPVRPTEARDELAFSQDSLPSQAEGGSA